MVVAAVGPACRQLPQELPPDLRLPEGFGDPRVCLPGVLAIQGPVCPDRRGQAERQMVDFCKQYQHKDSINQFPLLVVVDDSQMVERTLNNFLWVTFTRSDPATDLYGIEEFVSHKHWGCRGALVMDGRAKRHHAPPLLEDPTVSRRVDALAACGGPLAKFL